MTPAIGHAIFAVSNSLAASIMVKATIVISIALIAAHFARHSRASVRHAILTAGFAVLLALPIAAVIAPPLHIALPIAQGSSSLATNSAQSFDETSLAPRVATNTPSSAAKSEATSFSLFDFFFAVWVIGAAVVLAPVIIGLWQIRSLRRTALPWSHGTSVAFTLANELKISRRIEVLLHEAVAGPMTCGIFRPAAVFPMEAENWDDADLNRAIAHELEHVRRADWLTHCLVRIVCAAYWFHPFIWIAWRQLTLEAERACDDAVLARSEATAYAEQLVALARQLTAAHKSPLLAMASRSDLAARINAVLDTGRARGRIGKIATTLACAVAIFGIALSTIQISAAAPQSSAQDWEKAAGGKKSFEVASLKPGSQLGPGVPIFSNFVLGQGDKKPPDGLLTATNVPLSAYIAFAYKLDVTQFGPLAAQMPQWSRRQPFDIDARPQGSNLTRDQVRLMMQSLLVDRFKLAVHFETKDGPAYALVLARAGKLGSQMQAFPDGFPCSEPQPEASPSRPVGRGGATPTVATVDEGRLPASCGGIQTLPPMEPGTMRQAGRNVSIHALIQWISMFGGLDRPLMDRTGLSGTFDVVLNTPLPPQVPPGVDPATVFREAFSDQLGLKLQSITAPVSTLIIDHIEPPTPN